MISSDFRREAREKLTGKWGKAALITLIYLLIVALLDGLGSKTESIVSNVISIITLIISVPISYGLTMTFFKLFNNDNVGYVDFLTDGFKNFSRSWKVALHTFVKLILPIILVIISYIILILGIGGLIFDFSNSISLSTETISNLSPEELINQIKISTKTMSTSFATLTIIGLIAIIASTIYLTMRSYYYELSELIAIDNPDILEKDAVMNSKKLMTGNRFKLFCLNLSFIGWIILASFSCGIGLLFITPYMALATVSFYKYLLKDKETNTEN